MPTGNRVSAQAPGRVLIGVDLLSLRPYLVHWLLNETVPPAQALDIENSDLERLIIDYTVMLINRDQSQDQLRNWLLSTLLELGVYPRHTGTIADRLDTGVLNAISQATPMDIAYVNHAKYLYTGINARSYFEITYGEPRRVCAF